SAGSFHNERVCFKHSVKSFFGTGSKRFKAAGPWSERLFLRTLVIKIARSGSLIAGSNFFFNRSFRNHSPNCISRCAGYFQGTTFCKGTTVTSIARKEAFSAGGADTFKRSKERFRRLSSERSPSIVTSKSISL